MSWRIKREADNNKPVKESNTNLHVNTRPSPLGQKDFQAPPPVRVAWLGSKSPWKGKTGARRPFNPSGWTLFLSSRPYFVKAGVRKGAFVKAIVKSAGRFRLGVHFDIEHAQLVYQILEQRRFLFSQISASLFF